MPRLDGRGPRGMGSMSGRGMGYCARTEGRVRGRGYGFNRLGRARGLAREVEDWDFPTFQPEEEKAMLEDEKRYFESRLKEIKQILEEFDEE